jgi:rhodanese-related sulfurtransferase
MSLFQSLLTKKIEADYKELVRQGALIIDVRTKEEFRGGHVAQAINIPLQVLPAKIASLARHDTCIITCCASGARSGIAKNILHAAGYANVHNGGEWSSLVRALQ